MTAYLKAHYPVEFMAALLSSDIPGRNFTTKDSLVEHMEDCQRMDIEVVPPDVNRSDVEFTVGRRQDLLRPVGHQGLRRRGRRGDRRGAPQAGGPFATCSTSASGSIPRTATARPSKSLIKAGAFDSLRRPSGRSCSPCSTGPCSPARGRVADRRTRPEEPVRRRGRRATPRRRRQACPTCPSGTSANGCRRKRKCWASTSPAIRWPNTKQQLGPVLLAHHRRHRRAARPQPR